MVRPRPRRAPLHGQDVAEVWDDLLARADRGEITDPFDPDRKATADDIIGTAFGAFYGPDWQPLSEVPWSSSARARRRRPRSPTRRPLRNPFAAVFCQDWAIRVKDHRPVLRPGRPPRRQLAPHMRGSSLGHTAMVGCVGLPERVNNPQHRLRHRGRAEDPMTNALHDPATGYEWAANAHRQTRGATVLLTYEGWGHGVYGRSDCTHRRGGRLPDQPEDPASRSPVRGRGTRTGVGRVPGRGAPFRRARPGRPGLAGVASRRVGPLRRPVGVAQPVWQARAWSRPARRPTVGDPASSGNSAASHEPPQRRAVLARSVTANLAATGTDRGRNYRFKPAKRGCNTRARTVHMYETLGAIARNRAYRCSLQPTCSGGRRGYRGHRLGAHQCRTRAVHDPGTCLLLRRHGPVEECAQHDDDELRRDRPGRCALGVVSGSRMAFGYRRRRRPARQAVRVLRPGRPARQRRVVVRRRIPTHACSSRSR